MTPFRSANKPGRPIVTLSQRYGASQLYTGSRKPLASLLRMRRLLSSATIGVSWTLVLILVPARSSSFPCHPGHRCQTQEPRREANCA